MRPRRPGCNLGKFSIPVPQENGKVDIARFADALSEGILNRLVRAQLSKAGDQG